MGLDGNKVERQCNVAAVWIAGRREVMRAGWHHHWCKSLLLTRGPVIGLEENEFLDPTFG